MTTQTESERVAEAERLHKLATPGEWHRLHDIDGAKHPECQCAQVWAKSADWPVAYCDTQSDGEGLTREKQMDNAASIAALHNIAPALFAAYHRLQAVEAERDAMREALAQCASDWVSPPTTVSEGASLLYEEFARRARIAHAALAKGGQT